jgi:hypothetical protein
VIFDTINFPSTATPPYTYEWDFGDGQTGQGFPVTHTYAGPGPYYPTVSGRDSKQHHYTGNTVEGVYPPQININPVVDDIISVSWDTVTLTDLSVDPDYNTCGHSGNGRITVNWYGTGLVDARDVALTDTPSNAVFTRSFPGFSGTIKVIHTVRDNGGSEVSKVTNIIVPQKFTVEVTTLPALSGVTLILKQNGQTKGLGTTNASGTYTFSNLNPGTYQVQALKSGYVFDGDSALGGNQNPVTVTLGPNKIVTFTHVP